MTIMKFSDGITFDTSGPLRIECRRDGYYVVGGGMLCAVSGPEEGARMIAEREATRQAARTARYYCDGADVNLRAFARERGLDLYMLERLLEDGAAHTLTGPDGDYTLRKEGKS